MAVDIERLPEEYREIYDRFIMKADTNIQLSSVILSDENKQKVKGFLKETEYRDRLYDYGLEPDNRILMYGASGTGKTFLSKALSNHLGYTMLMVDIAKSLSDGDVSINISDIFKLGNYLGYCLIFFDEVDSIAWSRDAVVQDSGTIRRATNSIFQQLDQMNHTNIFIAATNMLHRLDPAFERRFNLKMEFRRPSLDIKECIHHFIFPKFIIDDDVDKTTVDIISRRAKNYAKLSYYEIQNIVERAMKKAVLNDTNVVKTSDVYKDLAIAMKIKLQFHTGDDPEEIFESPKPHWD